MRTSRNSINPQINIAISILRQVGRCSLEKTMETLVLLGNLVFGQEWVRSSDVSNKRARQRSILPTGTSTDSTDIESENSKKKRRLKKITKQTAPTQAYVRKFESSVYTPLALQSVAQELKSPNLVTSTVMYDGATIKKGKTMTTGVVNAVKDPSSGRITTHFRELGILEMVNTDAGSSFKAVASTLRNAAVLDSSTTENLDILESTKDVLSKVDYVVTDLGGEMRPVANKFSDFKVSLGHTSRPTYIHCNAHISPAFDAEIDKELYAIEQLLDLKSYVDKGFNSSFFSANRSCTYTMLHALFGMLGSSLYRQKEQSWSCQKDFNEFLEATNQPLDTFFDPNSSRFGKESEMCFILAFNYENVSNFMTSVLRDNRMFKSCEYYIKCPCFREIVTSVALIFYHVYAPFLVAVGAETWLGHTLLKHSELFSYYPRLKKDLEQLTIDSSLLLNKSRLSHLSEFPQLSQISKVVYVKMADKIFADLDQGITSGEIESSMIEMMTKLICERLLMVIDRQVEEFYGGPDSVVGKALTAEPEKIDFAATTQLPCEHSVGALRQSYRRAPSANIETYSQHQIIKKSPLYQKLMTGEVKAEALGKMIALAKESATFKLYNQHRQDDQKTLKQEKTMHLHEQKKKRMKEAKDRANLVSLVKEHGGPCQTENDVDLLKLRFDGKPDALMKKLWLEIKYQKKIILCISSADQSYADLFKQRKLNRATGKYDPVPLGQLVGNLKQIINLHSNSEDGSSTFVISVEQFIRLAADRQVELQSYKHRSCTNTSDNSEAVEDIVTVDERNLTGAFYDGLIDEKFVAVYYSDDPSTPWYLGLIERVNSNEGCNQCEAFPLTELNSYEHCFGVRFCEVKSSTKTSNVPLQSNSEWILDKSSPVYHVTACQVVPCKVELVDLESDVVHSEGSSSSGKAPKKRLTSYIVKNVQDIDHALKNNLLYSLINSDGNRK
ncbi:hypothetical protein ACHWQZ_G019511 [Mnemiopsis leidyi]